MGLLALSGAVCGWSLSGLPGGKSSVGASTRALSLGASVLSVARQILAAPAATSWSALPSRCEHRFAGLVARATGPAEVHRTSASSVASAVSRARPWGRLEVNVGCRFWLCGARLRDLGFGTPSPQDEPGF